MSKKLILLTISASLSLPPLTQADSVARLWNEENLAAIRLSFPDPPVHSRNLFHVSVAMWDAWAAYDETATGYIHRESVAPPAGMDLATARMKAVSYAAYRLLLQRYVTKPHPNTREENSQASLGEFNARMNSLGYDREDSSTVGNDPAAVGNRVAQTIISWVLDDGSNENGGYVDPTYMPVNDPLILKLFGNEMSDPNRWQPLEFVVAFSQTGQPLDFTIQEFLGPHWGDVWPFALSRDPDQVVYHDPGTPPMLGAADDLEFKEGVVEVIRRSSVLDPGVAAMIDASPGAIGNNLLGTNDGTGHAINPATGESYPENMINEADYGRVIAEFWADGPHSETPPGHWNTLANEVLDHPAFERRFMGTGSLMDELEWDVKMYFALNGAVHDAAVAAWGCKRHYDYVRPISSIRYMGGLGQSSEPGRDSYDPQGLPLVPGLIELVTFDTAVAGKHAHLGLGAIGKVAILTWTGEPEDPENESSGVEWILPERWFPYQRTTFVTPAFAGYISGHSTFSRAAAEVLTRMTGSEFFPGGMGTHTVDAGELEFEDGPANPVQLQWATYYDAADQAGISRLYGGIHVPADDGPGRIVGSQCGIGAWELAQKYFDGSILEEAPNVTITSLPNSKFRLDWRQHRGLFYKVRRSGNLVDFQDEAPFVRATSDRGTHTISLPFPPPAKEFYQVQQSSAPE